ncbi:hypothetical protein C8J57DRAFT_967559, partial [Mycena rebaudengoi]
IRTPATPFTFTSPPNHRKRARSRTDENMPSGSTSFPERSVIPLAKRARTTPSSSAPKGKAGKRSAPRTDSEEIDAILTTIKAQGWSFAQFLFNVFCRRNNKGKPAHRSTTHAQMVSTFLAERAGKTVADIITEWMASPDGRITADSPNRELLFSTTVPYTVMKPVRA